MSKKKKTTKVEDMTRAELIEEALHKNVSGGTDTCATDAGPGCRHDTCYDGSCYQPDQSAPDPTPGNQTY